MTETLNISGQKLHTRLQTKSYIKLFLIFLLVKCTYAITTSLVASYFVPGITTGYTDEYWGLIGTFVLMVVFAPIIETLLFQVLVIGALLRYKVAPVYAMLISALLFGAVHHYNIIYVVVMFFSGLLYAYYYCLLRRRSITMAVLWTVLLHVSWNFIAFLNNGIFQWF